MSGQVCSTYLGYAIDGPGDGENALMNAGNDLANAGFDAGLLSQVGDVFTGFSYDDAGVFCADESTQGEGVVRGGRRRARLRR